MDKNLIQWQVIILEQLVQFEGFQVFLRKMRCALANRQVGVLRGRM